MAAPSDNVLEVEHLDVRFGERAILEDLSFAVARGSALAVIGPNGAGKTVLFRALIGAISHEGKIRWAPGTRLGYVPQKLDLERDLPLTGWDFLRARAALAGSAQDEVLRALAGVGLDRQAATKPLRVLSGGQFQRLLIAFALIGAPTVLLLDEPVSGIDEPGQEKLSEMIHRLQHEQSLTVLLISHELSLVFRYATSVLCLSRERAWFGAPKEVLTPETLRMIYGAPMGYHFHGSRD